MRLVSVDTSINGNGVEGDHDAARRYATKTVGLHWRAYGMAWHAHKAIGEGDYQRERRGGKITTRRAATSFGEREDRF